MRKLYVLHAENDPYHLKTVKEAFEKFGPDNVEVIPATTKEDAADIIKKHFLDIALVDLKLDTKSEPGELRGEDINAGSAVLRELKQRRPTCWRIIVTGNQIEAAELIKPHDALAHHILLKVYDKIREYAQFVFNQRREERIEINGIEGMLELLRKKKAPAADDADLTPEELSFLITRLFRIDAPGLGQNLQRFSYETMDLGALSLRPMNEGFSSTVVWAGRPQTRTGRGGLEGIWCAVKIGRPNRIATEVERYNRWVRFNLSQALRVEMLGYAMGDTLGALAYSFAGDLDDDKPTSLEKLFNNGDERATTCLNVLFNPSESDRFWYRVHAPTIGRQETENLRARLGYPDDIPTHPAPFSNAINKLRDSADFANDIIVEVLREGEIAWRDKSTEAEGRSVVLHLVDESLRFPTQRVLEPLEKEPFHICIVHGDLHAGNVLVNWPKDSAADPRVTLIDFAETGPGPIAQDFAMLEMSVRTSEKACAEKISTIVREQRLECDIWSGVWGPPGPADARIADPATPYWARISHLLGTLARKNFTEGGRECTVEHLTSREYAATCMMMACQRLRWELTMQQKLRLMVWIAHLRQQIVAAPA